MASPADTKSGPPMAESEATVAADTNQVSGAAALLDDQAHVEAVPKAPVIPERIAELSTTVDQVPRPAEGDTQRPLEPDTEDLGWSADPSRPVPVLHGMRNESLWLLVRRFNNQIYRVQKTETPARDGLDVYISNKEQFSPDKLKATLERLYITLVIGFASLAKHVARLRSWSDTARTGTFCAVYVAAWLTDLLMPATWLLLIVLILSPRARNTLFPPAPLAAIDAVTGQPKQPKAGKLGSKTSLTGAEETYEGEAAEQEASNVIGALGTVALSTAAAKNTTSDDAATDRHQKHKKDSNETQLTDAPASDTTETVPDPTKLASIAQDAQQAADGGDTDKGDKTKKPIEEAIFASLSPFMHILNNIADDWERMGNALSPTPPFSRWVPRCRLAALVSLILLASLLVTETMIYKGSTFALGFALFGQPIMDRVPIGETIAWLDKNVPRWREYLELRFVLLRGVPTNAQLTVTLLRIGEANKAPLPPPPAPRSDPQKQAVLGPDAPDSDSNDEGDGDGDGDSVELDVDGKEKKKKKPSKMIGLFKATAKAGVESALGVNRIKASTGSLPAKLRLGVVRWRDGEPKDGPVAFECRYLGKRGNVVVSTSATSPCVAFERGSKLDKDTEASFSVAIEDIVELRKVGGLGWKGKLVVGWALGREVADGLEMRDTQGNKYLITAVTRRDEVFNRLIAIGSQKWEVF